MVIWSDYQVTAGGQLAVRWQKEIVRTKLKTLNYLFTLVTQSSDSKTPEQWSNSQSFRLIVKFLGFNKLGLSCGLFF